jgi:UDP-N-acetylglucosamine enolpyruvyl transferase
MPISRREADEILADAELVPVLHASISRVKEVIAECLEADIPVAGGCPPGAGKG